MDIILDILNRVINPKKKSNNVKYDENEVLKKEYERNYGKDPEDVLYGENDIYLEYCNLYSKHVYLVDSLKSAYRSENIKKLKEILDSL